MEYLDLVETIVNLEAEYLGQAQERYYEMERDYEQPTGTQAP